MTYYLLPTSYTGDMVPITYRLEGRKKDLRTDWCKEHEKQEVKNVVNLLKLCGQYLVRIKEDRFILPDGRSAYRFMEALKKGV